MSSAVPEELINKFIAVCHTGSFDSLLAYVDDVLREGFGAYQLMKQLFTALLKSDELLDTHKAVIFEKIGVSWLS